MRFPINFVLYLGSAGLLGLAGYQFYHATSKLGAPSAQSFYERGSAEAARLIKDGRGAGASSATWSYMKQEWWAQFKDANFTGKLPPPPPDPTADQKKAEVPAVVQTPLENIIELITLVCDGHSGGTAGSTQIVVRYKPEAQVEPPPEELHRRELLRNGGAGAPSGPSDVALPQGGRDGGNRRGGSRQGPGPATPMPSGAQSTNEWIQTVKPGEALWGQYSNIKLARVSGDCDFAVFTRELPAAAGSGDGQEPPKPVEEKLYKLGVGISNAVMEAIRRLGGRAAAQLPEQPTAAASSGLSWIETDETMRKDNVVYIGRKDAARFQDSDELLAGVGLDNYVSRVGGSTRGVRIVNVDPQLASKYGVAPGEIILAINDVPVKTKSEAINVGKKQYDVGTRTFVIKFLNTAGQVIERTYQAPDKKN